MMDADEKVRKIRLILKEHDEEGRMTNWGVVDRVREVIES